MARHTHINRARLTRSLIGAFSAMVLYHGSFPHRASLGEVIPVAAQRLATSGALYGESR
jgi:hypothetical protein